MANLKGLSGQAKRPSASSGGPGRLSWVKGGSANSTARFRARQREIATFKRLNQHYALKRLAQNRMQARLTASKPIKKSAAATLHSMHKTMRQLAKSHGKSHPKTRSYARKVNRYHLIAASGGGGNSRSEAARKAWRTRRGH